LRPDGTLDPRFDPALAIDGDLPLVLALAEDAGGRIVVGGAFETVDGLPRRGVARLHADGQLDRAFEPAAGVEGGSLPLVSAIGVLSGGRIVLGGEFEAFAGRRCRNLAYLRDGGMSVPDGWTTDGTDGWVQAVAVQAGRTVLIGGTFSSVAGRPRQALARFHQGIAQGPELRVWTGSDRVWIGWEGPGRLQSRESLTDPWLEEAQGNPPVPVDPRGPARFYRVVE
jgi:hypothetical protein